MQGTSTFTLTAVDAFGCINSDQVIINEYSSPLVDAGDDTTLCDLPISVDFDGSPNGGIWIVNLNSLNVQVYTLVLLSKNYQIY